MMKAYIFRTITTMKKYNAKHWWIDGNIITEKVIAAETLTAALEEYKERVENDHYINISRNALKTKRPMFVDLKAGGAKQVGYVITGQADFETENYRWRKQYVDLWVEVITTTDTDF